MVSSSERQTPPAPGFSVSANLADPVVPAIIDPLDPTGLVQTGTQEGDLEIQVPMWAVLPPAGRTDRLELYWGDPATRVASESFTGPVDPGRFPFSLYVPQAQLQVDGSYPLFYRVVGFSGVSDECAPRMITLDTLPPSYDKQLEALLLPVDLTSGLIDQAYLDSHGDKVQLSVPTPFYLGIQAGDVLSLYWSRNNPPTTGVLKTKTITQGEIDAEDIRVDLLGEEIREDAGDGLFYATYKIRDRAGNETPFSRETTAIVVLQPGGGSYPEPEFPDANAFGYYNCEHDPKVWDGIRVRLTLGTAFDVGDLITLFWEGYRTLNGVDPIDGTQGRFEADVRQSDLSAGFLDLWVRPYAPYIEPIVFGSGIARYLVTKVTGQIGISSENLVKIDLLLPGGGSCKP